MKEHEFEVSPKDGGARIDKWLVKKLNLPRSRVKDLLDNGRVLVNQRRVVIAGWELEPHDHVLVRIPKHRPVPREPGVAKEKVKTVEERPGRIEPPAGERVRRSALRHIGKPTVSYRERQALELKEKKEFAPEKRSRRLRKRKKKKVSQAPTEEMRFVKVYYEDKHLIVAEKPAGVLTLPQQGSDLPCFTHQVMSYLRRKHPGSQHSFLKPLHRLDRETSGLVALAKSKAGEKLSQQFRSHSIQRNYIAAVHGSIAEDRGIIDVPLEKGSFGGGRKVRLAHGGRGKKARTEFRVQERYKRASLLDIVVDTGRTHQIRIHLAWKKHPVIGDRVYSEHRGEDFSFHRHALHAHKLTFRHPVTGKRMSFKSPLPKDMKDLVDRLREF